MPARIVVVGGGISGLAVTYELSQRGERAPGGIDLLCLEMRPRPGGTLFVEHTEGYACDSGPLGLAQSASASRTLLRRLGLEDQATHTTVPLARLAVYRAGRLRPIPSSLAGLPGSGLLSPLGALRLLAWPLLARRPVASTPSLHAFVARRWGEEAADVLADAVAGLLFAADPRDVPLGEAVTALQQLDGRRGALPVERRAPPPAGIDGRGAGETEPWSARLTVLPGGLAQIVEALAQQLGDGLRTGLAARWVERARVGAGYRLHLERGTPLRADAVVLACPADSAAALVEHLDPQLAEELASVPSAPWIHVCLGFPERLASGPPPPLGVLVPRGQATRMLGALWSSELASRRAPAGSRLLAAWFGGTHDGQAARMSDEELLRLARDETARVLEIDDEPRFARVLRPARAVVPPDAGAFRRRERIERRLREHPGLWICGGSYRGGAADDALAEARELAESVLAHLTSRS